jgi:hypothetical protein
MRFLKTTFRKTFINERSCRRACEAAHLPSIEREFRQLVRVKVETNFSNILSRAGCIPPTPLSGREMHRKTISHQWAAFRHFKSKFQHAAR